MWLWKITTVTRRTISKDDYKTLRKSGLVEGRYPALYVSYKIAEAVGDKAGWDGKSKYTKKTQERHTDGSYETITADFRKYPCIEDSTADDLGGGEVIRWCRFFAWIWLLLFVITAFIMKQDNSSIA